MAASNTIQTLLDKELIKPPKIQSEQTLMELLNNLHSIALTLMEFHDEDDVSSTERAVELFQYSLNNCNNDPAVRERLSAALRMLGQLERSAQELFHVIKVLEMIDDAGDTSTLCMLYLDLGFLIEDIMLPLPGAGYELIEPITNEKDAPKFTFELDSSPLSSIDCYRTAIGLDPGCGLAHKKLADALAIIGNNEEALREFEVAARHLPNDICCATHLHFASKPEIRDALKAKEPISLPQGIALAKKLDDISVETYNPIGRELLSDLAAKFELNGVLVFRQALSAEDVNVLSHKVDAVISLAAEGDVKVADLTEETKAATHRTHLALPLIEEERHTTVISNLMARLNPLLELILQSNDGKDIPLIGAGLMQTSPGAKAQDLHKDVHHYDRHEVFDDMPHSWDCKLNGYPRCISIQIQLTDTSTGGEMGSLQVLPGSHRPDTNNGSALCIERAVKEPTLNNGVIPVNVAPGTVTIYSSRLWHGGGANTSDVDRKFCFFTATEEAESAAPAGLIHTMQMEDVGKWCLRRQPGLVKTS